jgi:hypothetical protein
MAGVNDSLDSSRRVSEEITRNTEHLLTNISWPLTVSMHLFHTERSQVHLHFSVVSKFFLLERFSDVEYEDSCGMRRLVFRGEKKSKCRRRDDILPGYITINKACKKSYIFCHSDEEQDEPVSEM